MSEQGNILLVGCGDKRLGASLITAVQEKVGAPTYNLLVPGPDAGTAGDEDHFSAVLFLVKRFYELTNFSELVIVTHEDCAGCKATPSEHEQKALDLGAKLASAIGFHGKMRCFISRRPANDDFAPWVLDEAIQA